MSNKILVCRIAWMEHYRGVGRDKVTWGGDELDVRDWWEVFNFEPSHGRYFGNVYLVHKGEPMTIHLERLDAGSAERTDNVLVVWAAFRPGQGPVVIGWYDNATVFRAQQKVRMGDRIHHYYVTAKTSDSVLLDVDQRLLPVPRGKGLMGQQNTWVPEPNGAFSALVRSCVDRYRETGRFLPEQPAVKRRPGRAWQPDLEKRLAVERAAISKVARHYEKAGYIVESVEKKDTGWDLEARRKEVSLKLEVKGLSESAGTTELTPNEYRMSQEHQDDYRICIVTSALEKPRLSVFHYSASRKGWVDDAGTKLGFEVVHIKAARLSIGE